jgi:hypothetical protein
MAHKYVTYDHEDDKSSTVTSTTGTTFYTNSDLTTTSTKRKVHDSQVDEEEEEPAGPNVVLVLNAPLTQMRHERGGDNACSATGGTSNTSSSCDSEDEDDDVDDNELRDLCSSTAMGSMSKAYQCLPHAENTAVAEMLSDQVIKRDILTSNTLHNHLLQEHHTATTSTNAMAYARDGLFMPFPGPSAGSFPVVYRSQSVPNDMQLSSPLSLLSHNFTRLSTTTTVSNGTCVPATEIINASRLSPYPSHQEPPSMSCAHLPPPPQPPQRSTTRSPSYLMLCGVDRDPSLHAIHTTKTGGARKAVTHQLYEHRKDVPRKVVFIGHPGSGRRSLYYSLEALVKHMSASGHATVLSVIPEISALSKYRVVTAAASGATTSPSMSSSYTQKHQSIALRALVSPRPLCAELVSTSPPPTISLSVDGKAQQHPKLPEAPNTAEHHQCCLRLSFGLRIQSAATSADVLPLEVGCSMPQYPCQPPPPPPYTVVGISPPPPPPPPRDVIHHSKIECGGNHDHHNHHHHQPMVVTEIVCYDDTFSNAGVDYYRDASLVLVVYDINVTGAREASMCRLGAALHNMPDNVRALCVATHVDNNMSKRGLDMFLGRTKPLTASLLPPPVVVIPSPVPVKGKKPFASIGNIPTDVTSTGTGMTMAAADMCGFANNVYDIQVDSMSGKNVATLLNHISIEVLAAHMEKMATCSVIELPNISSNRRTKMERQGCTCEIQ